ncbi:MAG: hypothetical protein ACRDTJ_27215, partial [Pseudonocardiaceae bacterium]
MAWELTDDVEVYAELGWPLLAAHPADNTLPLTVLETVRAGQRWSAEPMVFGWYDGPVVLVGHSMGGSTVTGVANSAAELLARLV